MCAKDPSGNLKKNFFFNTWSYEAEFYRVNAEFYADHL